MLKASRAGDQQAQDEAPHHGEDDDCADPEVDLGLADQLDGDGNDERQRGNRKRQPGTGLADPRGMGAGTHGVPSWVGVRRR
jgi:hypothetical protein